MELGLLMLPGLSNGQIYRQSAKARGGEVMGGRQDRPLDHPPPLGVKSNSGRQSDTPPDRRADRPIDLTTRRPRARAFQHVWRGGQRGAHRRRQGPALSRRARGAQTVGAVSGEVWALGGRPATSTLHCSIRVPTASSIPHP